jgi:hypothetical protein
MRKVLTSHLRNKLAVLMEQMHGTPKPRRGGKAAR